MNYRGLYISKCRDTGIEREDKNGNTVTAEGWFYQVFTDDSMAEEIDNFCGAVGYELSDDSEETAEQFARQVVDMEIKEYQRYKNELTM
ncbi:hypothetical protein [Ruminococcus sp. Marseille-P6503]|uniref:hypothetical protein n=1 Tax=Ruminococcus sp. Marseille-P6503 TaxID=2364796 RepID=UPI000F530966|nr:hypothetical protein [Ruminococcus sp. Marseille-P6503]